MSRKKDLVVLEKGKDCLKTLLTDDFKCVYDGEDYSEHYNNKDSKYLILPFKEASVIIDQIEEKKYIKEWENITEKEWDYYLNVLPPTRWKTVNGVEIFAISERTTSDISLHLVHYKNKYFKAERRLTTTHKEIAQQIKELNNELELEYIGEDDWGRRCFQKPENVGKRNKMIYKQVDKGGWLFTSTKDLGEPEGPLKKELIIKIKNTGEILQYEPPLKIGEKK